MESTHEANRPEPGVGAALLAFAVFSLIAAAGVLAVHRRGGFPDAEGPSGSIVQSADGSTLKMVAVMRQVRHSSQTSEFRRADLVAIAGRASLDLREARMAGDSAEMKVVVMGGRADVKVPPDWAVVTKGSLAVGALENRARQAEGDTTRTLLLNAVVFGGRLEVTH
jgi:hypothetical protein